MNIEKEEEDSYWEKVDEFCKLYATTKENLLLHPKEEYRYFCFRYLEYMRCMQLPIIRENLAKETVLIEFRRFPHLEFLLRNMILRTGSDWSHTIVCGSHNYRFCQEMVLKINLNIKIIQLPIENADPASYNLLLTSSSFWNLFTSEKILLYQEDTCIFKNNINDFLEWDYIGASWPIDSNDNEVGVGNGGFSLRTRQCMLQVLEKENLKEMKFNSSTLDYMERSDLKVGPEDVFFTLNMIRHKIGKVAPRIIANRFSAESYFYPNVLGGHNFWLSNPKWKDYLYRTVVIQFRPKYENILREHRGGWTSIMKYMKERDFFSRKASLVLYDSVENYFLWERTEVCLREWVGIFHCTPHTPDFWDIVNVNNIFNNKNFMKSLQYCRAFYSLSHYLTKFLQTELEKRDVHIPIYTMFHPIENENYLPFNFQKYILNGDKKLIQIGQQLRKMTSILFVEPPLEFEKLWLTGTRNLERCMSLLKKEIVHFKFSPRVIRKKMSTFTGGIKYSSVEEYDEYLSQNIVFIDLFDASANNAILECILRSTPIIVNKIEAVVEYLGEDYPLYFESLDDVPALLEQTKLFQAHKYLRKMDKTKFHTNHFIHALVYPLLCKRNDIKKQNLNV